MRRFSFLAILVVFVLALVSIASADPPPGKGKPPRDDVVISLNFEYSGPDEPEPADSCVFAETFSWDQGVKGSFEYTATNGSEIVASDTVTFRRPGSQVFFEFSISPAYVGDEFEIHHTATLTNHKGKVVAEFDDDPGTTLTCNAWGQNP